jgi:hypothetical protein
MKKILIGLVVILGLTVGGAVAFKDKLEPMYSELMVEYLQDEQAMLDLVDMYKNGANNVRKNKSKTKKYTKMLANKEYSDMQYNMAIYNKQDKNITEYENWLIRSSDNGYKKASLKLAQHYYKVLPNYLKARDDRHAGKKVMTGLLGGLVGNALGNSRDGKRLGALAGAALGASLADNYDLDIVLDGEKSANAKKAFTLYEIASTSDDYIADFAKIDLSLYYALGIVVKKDLNKAKELITSVDIKGDSKKRKMVAQWAQEVKTAIEFNIKNKKENKNNKTTDGKSTNKSSGFVKKGLEDVTSEFGKGLSNFGSELGKEFGF